MAIGTRKARQQRHRKRVAVQFGTEGPTSSGFATNVSAWGLGVSSLSVQRPGTYLVVEVRVSATRVARLTARVSWACRGTPALGIPNTMGLRLETSDEAWLEFISTIAEAARKPGEVVEVVSHPPRQSVVKSAASRGGPPRTLVRHQVAWLVRFGVGATVTTAGKTVDVSAMGVAVAAPTVPPVGSQLFLEVVLPGGTVVRCEGIVVRLRGAASVAARPVNVMAVRLQRADEAWYREVLALEPVKPSR